MGEHSVKSILSLNRGSIGCFGTSWSRHPLPPTRGVVNEFKCLTFVQSDALCGPFA